MNNILSSTVKTSKGIGISKNEVNFSSGVLAAGLYRSQFQPSSSRLIPRSSFLHLISIHYNLHLPIVSYQISISIIRQHKFYTFSTTLCHILTTFNPPSKTLLQPLVHLLFFRIKSKTPSQLSFSSSPIMIKERSFFLLLVLHCFNF